ncbi:MAG TPA: hypothetical protein VMV69_04100 [Pirellulales bacterium]|nr:hypothetical protein [Pirellulales bacterium]
MYRTERTSNRRPPADPGRARAPVFAPRRFAAWLTLAIASLGSARARAELPFESAPIHYLTFPLDDPVARLNAKLERGEVTLNYDEARGYLPAVLEQLHVPVSSQVLVFSKTSFQRTKISRRAPRAVYFNDETYVGFVQHGDVVELSTTDPRQGAVFYTLGQRKVDKPLFARQTHDCLQCHASSKTQEVPGHLVRSVYPDLSGMPVFNAGTFTTSHESPLKERWGGWFVSGRHGAQVHMGNVVVTDRRRPERLDTVVGANVTDLSSLVDTLPYLTGHSDIVALMVLEHQTKAHNLITAANYHARLALEYEKGLSQALGKTDDALSQSTQRRIQGSADKLLRYLLFVDEAPLEGKIEGTSGFAEEFAARGPRDRHGRSLRDFDLDRRLFKYPCSYEIYSECFDALPDVVRIYLDRRLYDVLTGHDASPDFTRLAAAERQAILEILRDTKPGLPDYWRRK